MVIRNAGHLKMSLQTSVDSLMGSAFVNLLEGAELSTNCVVPVDFILNYLVNLFIILSPEWFIFHGA